MSSSPPTPSAMNKKRSPKARKSRAKAKKPRFLSLRLQCWVEEAVIGQTRASAAASVEVVTTSPVADSKSHGLNLFPLHPESQILQRIQGLALKLDYQEILKVWSNKGPLYVDAENSQIVPDMSDGFLLQESSSYNVMGLWKVPEMGQREASLLRYKEKRRSRLHSKKIRYQVRKLNADKRPRLKVEANYCYSSFISNI